MITGMPRIAVAMHDFTTAVSTFRDKLGIPVIDLSDSSVDKLGARLAMCVPRGGSNIELMSPADPSAPLSQSLQRFLESRGEGLFALMLEAPDPDAEAEDLSERGLNVLPSMAGASGRDVHPNSTHGVLIRVYPVNSFKGQPDDSDSGLSGIARVIIAVHDLDHAVKVYGTWFAMAVSEPSLDAERGVRFAQCNPPTGGVIELVSAEDRNQPFAKSIADFLEGDREGMYALVLQSQNLEASVANLTAHGLEVRRAKDSPEAFEVQRTSTFGARIRIESS